MDYKELLECVVKEPRNVREIIKSKGWRWPPYEQFKKLERAGLVTSENRPSTRDKPSLFYLASPTGRAAVEIDYSEDQIVQLIHAKGKKKKMKPEETKEQVMSDEDRETLKNLVDRELSMAEVTYVEAEGNFFRLQDLKKKVSKM